MGEKKTEREAREYSIYNSSFYFNKYLLIVFFLKSILTKTATGRHFYCKVIENSKFHMDEIGNSRDT